MLQKVQVLQKRLIGKAEEAVSKGAELSAKDRLYAELKAILARQPGPEIAEQLAVYRNALREKDQQTEQMASELAMCDARRPTARARAPARASRPTGRRVGARRVAGRHRAAAARRARADSAAGTMRKWASTRRRSTGWCASCTR